MMLRCSTEELGAKLYWESGDGRVVCAWGSGVCGPKAWEALDWTKSAEELEQQKLERWRRMWKTKEN